MQLQFPTNWILELKHKALVSKCDRRVGHLTAEWGRSFRTGRQRRAQRSSHVSNRLNSHSRPEH